MSLPLSVFDQIAKGFTFLLGGRVYKVDSVVPADDNCLVIGDNRTGRTTLPLIELEEATRIEGLEQELNGEGIASAIRETFSGAEDLITNSAIDGEIAEKRLLEFICTDIFPYFDVPKRLIESAMKEDRKSKDLGRPDALRYSRIMESAPFISRTGIKANSLEQLVDIVKEMHPTTFRNHAGGGNDFYYWINNEVGDVHLADEVLSLRSKNELIRAIRQRLAQYKTVIGDSAPELLAESGAPKKGRRSRLSSMVRQYGQTTEIVPDNCQRQLHTPEVGKRPNYDYSIGDTIQIVRHLGFLNNLGEDVSYSGIPKAKLPLGTELEIVDIDGELLTASEPATMKKGITVRLRDDVRLSDVIHGQGKITHRSIGIIKGVEGHELVIDFPEQKGFKGHSSQYLTVGKELTGETILHSKEVRKHVRDAGIKKERSLLQEAFARITTGKPDGSFMVLDQFVYRITKPGNATYVPDARLVFGGEEYRFTIFSTRQKLIESYDSVRTEHFRNAMIGDQPRLRQIRNEKSRLMNLLGLVESGPYEVFARRVNPSRVDIILRLPEYINIGDTESKNPHDWNFFRFPRMNLRMPITIKKGEIHYDRVVVLGYHSQPFTGLGVEDKDICYGDFNFTQYRDAPVDKRIAVELKAARTTIMSGYDPFGHGSGKYRPRNHLSVTYYEDILLKGGLEEALNLEKEQGIQITNWPHKIKRIVA